jgi:hypothetical protein
MGVVSTTSDKERTNAVQIAEKLTGLLKDTAADPGQGTILPGFSSVFFREKERSPPC